MSRKLFAGLLIVVLSILLSVPAFAQDATPEATGEAGGPPPMEMPPLPEGAEVVASGLNSPRHLTIGSDGTIYVAQNGFGGDTTFPATSPDGAEVTAAFGFTGDVTAIAADGTTSVVVANLPSIALGEEVLGPSGVAVTDDTIWVTINGYGPSQLTPVSFLASAVSVNAANGRMSRYVDLYGYELANDPDGNDTDSNPTAVEVAPDGTVYIMDTGANALYSWTAEAGFGVVHVWPDNPVPTAVDVGPDGNLYISFLGAEIAPGTGKVEVWSAGELVDTFSGYNALTDLAVAADGTIYAVSIFAGFGEQGPNPGQIVRVNAEGGEVVVDGLLLPYGIDIDADGNLLVTTGSAFVPPGAGMILRFAPGM